MTEVGVSRDADAGGYESLQFGLLPVPGESEADFFGWIELPRCPDSRSKIRVSRDKNHAVGQIEGEYLQKLSRHRNIRFLLLVTLDGGVLPKNCAS